MNDEDHELPIWRNFDDSPLPLLLRYDRLSPQVAIPLLCNIDTDRSEKFSAYTYFGLFDNNVIEAMGGPYDDPDPIRDWMTKDYPEYWRIRLLSDRPEVCPRCWYESLAGISEECERWRHELLTAVPPGFDEGKYFGEFYTSHQLETYDPPEISEHNNWQQKLEKAWKIYFSNPDHYLDPSRVWDQNDYEQRTRRPPIYFIDWAETKGIEIPWLDWAKSNGLVQSPKAKDPIDKDELREATPMEKRRKEGIHAAIKILNQKYANGELNAWQDFERWMKKSFVIQYIRANPSDFPNCSRIKSKSSKIQEQSLAEQEPTLARGFPSFATDPSILSEYERLTSKD